MSDADKYGLQDMLKLKVGLKYMITSNIDVPDGLFNGAVGILMQIDINKDPKESRVWLEFDSKTGINTRKNN